MLSVKLANGRRARAIILDKSILCGVSLWS